MILKVERVISIEDFYFEKILIDEKSYTNILVYDISYKTLSGSKPLRIRFDEVDGFIRVYDGTRYLTLLGSQKHDAIYNRNLIPYYQKKWHYICFPHNYANTLLII